LESQVIKIEAGIETMQSNLENDEKFLSVLKYYKLWRNNGAATWF